MSAPLDALASDGAAILGRALSGLELQLFEKYLKLLQKWQKAQRLVGSSDPLWIVNRLLLDSLLFLRVLPSDITSLADVGSGAGLPGIPLKIVRPDLRVVLIESRAKRASFLSAAIRELELARIQVAAMRVEDYIPDPPFDAAVMRCAGRFEEMIRSVQRIIRPGGIIVASGPPTANDTSPGGWIDIEGILGPSRRRFLTYVVR